ncbi:MAG: hypothetical protein ACNS62_24575 [Candidatus Cyclobacteriaceae bacterium M3_2C_046]
MKNHNIDDFFRQKIKNQEVKPSQEAWNKLNRQMHHKKQEKSSLKLKIAAGLALLMIFSAILYFGYSPSGDQIRHNLTDQTSQDSSGLTQAISPKLPEKNQELADQIDVPTQEQPSSQEFKSKETPATLPSSNDQVEKIRREKIMPDLEKPALALSDSAAKPAAPQLMLAENDQEPAPVIDEAEQNANMELPPVTITYVRSSSQPALAEQKPEPEKDKNQAPLKKFLGLAQGIKNSDLGLADIRQVKDEILAIDISFKKINNTKKDNN